MDRNAILTAVKDKITAYGEGFYCFLDAKNCILDVVQVISNEESGTQNDPAVKCIGINAVGNINSIVQLIDDNSDVIDFVHLNTILRNGYYNVTNA